VEAQSRLDRLEWLAAWSRLWSDLCRAFAHSKPAPGAMDLYAEYLADLPVPALEAAVRQSIATCRHLPTIAEVREAARAVSGSADESAALVAYGRTMEELSRARSENRPARIDDEIAREVVRALGGGYYLLASDSRSTDRAHFLHAYRDLAEARARDARVSPQARAALGMAPAAAALAEERPRLRLAAPLPPPPADPTERMAPDEWRAAVREAKASVRHPVPAPSGFRLLAAIEPLTAGDGPRMCRLCGSELPDDDSGCSGCRRRAEERRRELQEQARRLAEGESA
jgi:hypothetical protein